MKKLILYFLIFFVASSIFTACDSENELKLKETQIVPEKSEAYYESLRAYKKSEHYLAFGWFGNWSAAGPAMSTRLANVPDSMDIVSIWGDYTNVTPEMAADMEYVQRVKGIKVIFTTFAHEVPEPFEATTEGVAKYAKALSDTATKYNYDGIDLDYEPGFGGVGPLVGHNNELMKDFTLALSKYFGPTSNTGRLLIIDGVPYAVHTELAKLFDHGIVQAYNSSGDSDLQSRFNDASAKGWRPDQYIFSENFESFWSTGGNPNYKDSDGNIMHSLKGMARFNPTQGKKSGIGTYHMEYEYLALPDYKYLREAIQIMNPAIKE